VHQDCVPDTVRTVNSPPRLVDGNQRNHHYAPQFYLRAWANQHGGLRLFDGWTGYTRNGGVRTAGCEEYFYAMDLGPDTKSNVIETWLADNVDGPAGRLVPELRDALQLTPNHTRYLDLMRFLSFQAARTPRQWAMNDAFVAHAIGEAQASVGAPRPTFAPGEAMSQKRQIEQMVNTADLVSHGLAARTWEIYVAPGAIWPTGDNPLVWWNSEDQAEQLHGAHLELAPQVILALSPQRLLVGHHRGLARQPVLGVDQSSGPRHQEVWFNYVNALVNATHQYVIDTPGSPFDADWRERSASRRMFRPDGAVVSLGYAQPAATG